MEPNSITVTEGASVEERSAVIGGLVGYNTMTASDAHHRELAVIARADAEIVGGLLGHTNWNWLFISHLWLAEPARGGGTGRKLIAAAEQEAIMRGCAHAHCDTFGFQALPFYQKLGYELFGQLDDYPQGHTRYYLQKRILNAASS